MTIIGWESCLEEPPLIIAVELGERERGEEGVS
jgi:hypothetical protein